ncbi:uncharacterized protein LOC131210222 [Anopheles bellator]|uniref:uncharacterized protein LOC131210222 n=1 Tax=Anopheles bellator TaxID=139047 RepID=UPI00264800B0|nr:uncharacterized protein LOC131210222 [Anopheles bellator]
MAFVRLVAILVAVWGPTLATTSLATNDVHLPEETDHRQHQKGTQMNPKASATPFVTYHVEHEQSEYDARRYVALLNESEIHRLPSWCHKHCNSSLLHYCRSNNFLNDHCCCEYSHTKEQLPWMPHTCLRQLGERCSANAGSCSNYRAIKECCCDRLTKLEYKIKFSAATSLKAFLVSRLTLFAGLIITLVTTTTAGWPYLLS